MDSYDWGLSIYSLCGEKGLTEKEVGDKTYAQFIYSIYYMNKIAELRNPDYKAKKPSSEFLPYVRSIMGKQKPKTKGTK